MAKVNTQYGVTAMEYNITTHGLSFLCIFGEHVNGAYIAIVNFGISAELSALDDIGYNTMSILKGLLICEDKWLPKSKKVLHEIAEEIAEAINPYISNGGE